MTINFLKRSFSFNVASFIFLLFFFLSNNAYAVYNTTSLVNNQTCSSNQTFTYKGNGVWESDQNAGHTFDFATLFACYPQSDKDTMFALENSYDNHTLAPATEVQAPIWTSPWSWSGSNWLPSKSQDFVYIGGGNWAVNPYNGTGAVFTDARMKELGLPNSYAAQEQAYDATHTPIAPASQGVINRAITTYTPISGSGIIQAFGLGSGNSIQITDLGTFLSRIFDLGIAIAVALAVIMCIWGGIEYMTADAWMGEQDGKKKITDALWGLGLAIASYVILFTINPCLVQFTATVGGQCTNQLLVVPPPSTQGTLPLNLGIPAPGGNTTGVLAEDSCISQYYCHACTNCVTETTVRADGIACKTTNTSCAMNADLEKKIVGLNISSIAEVSEGWPPHVNHSGPEDCHTYGTCVDIALINRASMEVPTDVIAFFHKLQTASPKFSKILFETPDCTSFISAGLPKVNCYAHPVAPHFHVVN